MPKHAFAAHRAVAPMDDDFRVALNVAQARLSATCRPQKCKAWASHLARCTARCSGCKVTHYPLQRLMYDTAPDELCALLEETRRVMATTLACALPNTPSGILELLSEHVATLSCDLHCEGACHSCQPGCVAEEEIRAASADSPPGPTGVHWGLLSPLPIVTFSPTLQCWFSWSNLEFVPVPASDKVHSSFRRVGAAELAAARGVDIRVAATDTRQFFSQAFVGASVRGEPVVHELVIATGGEFFAILAADVTTPSRDVYLFQARSKIDMGSNTPAKRFRAAEGRPRDAVLESQRGGYLTFICYVALRAYNPALPRFAFIATQAASAEREIIMREVVAYTTAASRVCLTEPFVQTIRRDVHLDASNERLSHELGQSPPHEHVFTGSVFGGKLSPSTEDARTYSRDCSRMNVRSDALLVLCYLNSLLNDSTLRRMSQERSRFMVWPKLLHRLHLEGNGKAATALASHMEGCDCTHSQAQDGAEL